MRNQLIIIILLHFNTLLLDEPYTILLDIESVVPVHFNTFFTVENQIIHDPRSDLLF